MKNKIDVAKEHDRSNKWGLEKKIGPATFVNLVQLITIVWFGSQFYTQVNDNQLRNEERFQNYSEEQKSQNDHMSKMEDVQNQLLLQITRLSDNQQNTSDSLKDIRDLLNHKH